MEKNLTLKSLEKEVKQVKALAEMGLQAAIHSLKTQRHAAALALAEAYEVEYAETSRQEEERTEA